MTEPIDDEARRTWQGGSNSPPSAAAISAGLTRRLADERSRMTRFWASAAIIAPSWVAVMWFMPDLRRLAAVGLIVAGWLIGQMYRRRRLLRVQPNAGQPCISHEREFLARERRFHDTFAMRTILPIAVGQVAIVVALLSNPRFEKNAFFAGSLTAFILTVVAVLTVALRRARRMVDEIDREIALLRKGLEV